MIHNGHQIYEQSLRLSDLASRMQFRGLSIDMEEKRRLESEVSAKKEEWRKEFAAVAPGVDIKESGNTQAAKDYFFETLRAPILKFTEDADTGRPTNTPALDSAVLQAYRQMDDKTLKEASKYLFYFKKNAKLLSSLRKLPVIDGCIYPQFKPWGTVSSRWACQNPNLQNFAKAKEETYKDPQTGKMVTVQITPSTRSLVRARPGYKLIGADFSQLELRGIIYVANLEEMRQWMDEGLCPHRMNAAIMFGLTYELVPKSSPLRQQAKNGIYAFSYNFTDNVQTIYEAWKKDFPDITLKYVQKVRNALMKAQPRLRDHQLKVAESVATLGYVEAPGLGRRRHFAGEHTDINAALNFPFQTGGGELVNRSMLNLDDAWQEQEKYIIGQIHDEILGESLEDKAEETLHEMKSEMESEFDIFGRKYSFPVDAHIGDNWGAIH